MKKLVCAMLVIFLLLPVMSQAEAPYEKYSMSFFGSFDTVISIIGYTQRMSDFEAETAKAQKSFHYYHQLFDKYNQYGELHNLWYVNQAAAASPVKVPEELFSLLEFAKEMYQPSQKMVNIALGPVLVLWHQAREDAELDADTALLPDIEALKEANQHTDLDMLMLDAGTRTVFFLDPYMQLDVGAVAKGYAAELVAQQLLRGPMTSFAINAGGNVRLGDPPRDGRKNWGVAVQDPDGFALTNPNSDVMDTLFLHNTSVVTSGDYQRYFIFQGERYHHIISPVTLMPPRYFRSITVITENSSYADLLSTALFLMPYEEGAQFVDTLQGVDAVWILNDRSMRISDGLKDKAKSLGITNPAQP